MERKIDEQQVQLVESRDLQRYELIGVVTRRNCMGLCLDYGVGINREVAKLA